MGASPEGRNVGQVLSRGEARRLSRETGKSVADIAGRATQKGVGIGAALGNQLGRAMASPYGQDARRLGVEASGIYQEPNRTMEALAPLSGLKMQKGHAYYGSTTTTTPASSTGYKDSRRDVPATTTTTPIVLPRGFGTATRAVTGGPQRDSGMRQAVTPPPPGIRRKDMGSYTPESLEARYTQAADRAQARSDKFTARAERTTNQKTGATKPRDVILRQRSRAENLKQKAEGYRAGAADIRARMSSPAM